MKTSIKILICALIIMALVGIVYAQNNISKQYNPESHAKKPHRTLTPTPTITIPTTYPTPIPNWTDNRTSIKT
jgi:hypothetical protein